MDWLKALDWTGVTLVAILVGVIGMAGYAVLSSRPPHPGQAFARQGAPLSATQHTHAITPG
jgi:ammonia channel protein AmtB